MLYNTCDSCCVPKNNRVNPKRVKREARQMHTEHNGKMQDNGMTEPER
jgi:hypothetical protein